MGGGGGLRKPNFLPFLASLLPLPPAPDTWGLDRHCKGVHQRIYISDRTHSTPQRLPNMCLTQPLPAPSDSQVVGEVFYVFYRQSRKRLGETHVWKTQRDAVRSITNIYSLGYTVLNVHIFYSLPPTIVQ